MSIALTNRVKVLEQFKEESERETKQLRALIVKLEERMTALTAPRVVRSRRSEAEMDPI